MLLRYVGRERHASRRDWRETRYCQESGPSRSRSATGNREIPRTGGSETCPTMAGPLRRAIPLGISKDSNSAGTMQLGFGEHRPLACSFRRLAGMVRARDCQQMIWKDTVRRLVSGEGVKVCLAHDRHGREGEHARLGRWFARPRANPLRLAPCRKRTQGF